MKILITGANGFIGSNLTERLVREGHKVIAFVRRNSSMKFLAGIEHEARYGDILDRYSLDSAMKGVEVVIHVAGLASDWGPYRKFYDINVVGTENVLETARKNGVQRVVHLSSTAIHGFGNFTDADETYPQPKTIWPYCETKRIAEERVLEFSKKNGMPVSVVRPGNVFGKNDHTFFEKYADALFAGKIGYICGGKAITCPTYVENLVEGIVRAAFAQKAIGEVFIITDGVKISWREFTEKIADALGAKRPKLSVPFSLMYGLAFGMESAYQLVRSEAPPLLTRYRISNGGTNYHFSTAKAERLLEYKPPVSLDEAVRRTANWYLNRK